MVWNEADCCEYVLLRLAQNTRIDEIRIEGCPALLYARRNNYGSLKKLMLEKNADPNTAEMEGEGEEGIDFEKTSDEGEVGEQQDIGGEEGEFDQKSEWSEIRRLQNYVTEIETGLHRRLTEVKASLAIAKLETSQVKERLGSQVLELKTKLKTSMQSNERLKWEIAELKTAIGVAKCQKSKFEKSLMCENRLLKKQLQQAVLEAKIASASKPQVVPQDEEKCIDQDDVPDPPKVVLKSRTSCDDWQPQQNDENGDQCSIEENLPPKENLKPEMFCVDDSVFVNEPSTSELASRFSSQIDELKSMFDTKTNLVVANAKLKSQLALQKLEQNKKLEEVRAKNRRFEKLVEIIRGKLKESKAKNRESKKILVFASAIVKKYLEVSAEREVSSSHVDEALHTSTSTNDYSRDYHQNLCIDIKVAQQVMLDALEKDPGREPFKELSRNISATKKDMVFVLDGSSQKESLWAKPLNQTPEDFDIKMPQNFKPSEREMEAVTSSFLVHPAG